MEEKKILSKKKSPLSGSKKSTPKKTIPEKKEKSWIKKESKPLKKETKSFNIKRLDTPAEVQPKEDKKLPTSIVLIFLFSLVFFLFALYKAFIYKQGYGEIEQYPLPLPESNSLIEGQTAQETHPLDENKILGENSWEGHNDEILEDMKLIQTFYQALTNNEIEEMNSLVDRPLKNSVTRSNHWNKKNIKIFTKHLANTVLLQDLFLIPGSLNEEKKTRQYSYTLKYTILPEHQFEETWELTLITRGEKNLISEIMCKTEGCSRSPFFWPQNYGLK